MLKDLIKLANDLDEKGLRAEADYLDRVIQKLAQEEESGSDPSTETGAEVDPEFLKRFHFVDPRENDKEHIAEVAYNTKKGDGYGIKENDILYNYNNGNYSIAVPTGETYKSHLGYEVYVSYADERAEHSSSLLDKELREKIEAMNFKESGLPAPMSDYNMRARGYMK